MPRGVAADAAARCAGCAAAATPGLFFERRASAGKADAATRQLTRGEAPLTFPRRDAAAAAAAAGHISRRQPPRRYADIAAAAHPSRMLILFFSFLHFGFAALRRIAEGRFSSSEVRQPAK